jgi:hypothetical protein
MSEEKEKYLVTQIWDYDDNLMGDWKRVILEKGVFKFRKTIFSPTYYFTSNLPPGTPPDYILDSLSDVMVPRPDWQVSPNLAIVTGREGDSIWAAIDRLYDLINEVKRLREEVDSLRFINGYVVKV